MSSAPTTTVKVASIPYNGKIYELAAVKHIKEWLRITHWDFVSVSK